MALSTNFCLPGPSFDPSKYAPKQRKGDRKLAATVDTTVATMPASELDLEPSGTEASRPSEDVKTQTAEAMAQTADADVMDHASVTTAHSTEGTTLDSTEDMNATKLPAHGIHCSSNTFAPQFVATPDAKSAQQDSKGSQQYVKKVQKEAREMQQDLQEAQKTVENLVHATQQISQMAKQIQFLTEATKNMIQAPPGESISNIATVHQPAATIAPQASTVEAIPAENKPAPAVQTAQAAPAAASPEKSAETDAAEARCGPPTLLSPEYLSLAAIPALPADGGGDEPFETPEARRLVSLRRIQNICPVKVQNRWLTVAQVDGWTCVVPRHAFRAGELVVFCMIDAFLPAADKRFGKMADLQTYQGIFGYRVKSQRYGAYPNKLEAQGKVYPLKTFREISEEIECAWQARKCISDGEPAGEELTKVILAMYRKKDWAEELKVVQWAEPAPVDKQAEFPKLGGIPLRVFKKTDITHFEDCHNLFTKQKYNIHEYQESVKMDGASMTVYFVKSSSPKFKDLNPLPQGEIGPHMVLDTGRFGVCSKNVDLHELNACNAGFWRTALRDGLPAKLAALGRSLAVQGELCGPGIQQNRAGLPHAQFFVFAAWDVDAPAYVDPRAVEGLARALGLQHVPVLRYVRIRAIAGSHAELRQLANGRPGEGLVYKCVRDGRSFKVHSTAYKILHDC